MRSALARKIAAAALALWIASAAAQGDGAASVPALQSSGSVRIQLIAQPREVELPSRFHLALRLVNSTSDPVVFRGFDLKPLEEPGGLRIADACSKRPQLSLASNTAVTILCEVYSDGFDDSLFGFLLSMSRSWSLLTLQPGEYRFVATAEVRSDKALMAISETVAVKIRPTVWQVCLGANLGALLLVMFALCSDPLRQRFFNHERSKALTPMQKWLVEPAVLWLGATTSASMFIFMTYRLKDVSGPFTITVNDFYGGVVIGLFGVFLAEWLAGKLFKAAPKEDK